MNATRYKATFRPQAWIRDYAVPVEPEGPVSWDCTSYVSALPETVRASVLVGSNYDSDDVRTDPSAPAWVREWSGPFEVDVEAIGPVKVRVRYRATVDAELLVPSDFRDDPESYISNVTIPAAALAGAEWLIDSVEEL